VRSKRSGQLPGCHGENTQNVIPTGRVLVVIDIPSMVIVVTISDDGAIQTGRPGDFS